MQDYDYDEYGQEKPGAGKSTRGYRIIVIVLAVILAAMSFIYFNQMNKERREHAEEQEILIGQVTAIKNDFDNLQVANDTMARNLDVERQKADSLMDRIASERRLTGAKIRQYEQQLGTLRSVLQVYVRQIDSLSTANRTLIAENVGYAQQVRSERLRADMAEESNEEMRNVIRRGAVVRARDITLHPLNNNDRQVNRANNATRLRVDFVLVGNDIALPGAKTVYVRVFSPDGYLLTNNPNAFFEFEGENRTFTAMREIDYANKDLDVGLYYSGDDITGGTYKIEVYMDGYQCGTTEVLLR